jgi:hypothetical protein
MVRSFQNTQLLEFLQYGGYLDLVFSNSSTDVAIETSAEQLLKLDRHHRAYEVSVDISACRYEPCSVDKERYKFAGADCESICRDLDLIDWAALFSLKKVDQCVDLFYEAV